MRKRILSMLTALVMAGGILSVPSYATEVEEDTSVLFEVPFLAVTTDAGDVLEIEDMGTLDYDCYTDIPYYVVNIPEGATSVDITYPEYVDPNCIAQEESGLYAQGIYMNLNDGSTGEKLDFDCVMIEDGYLISLPLCIEVYDSAAEDWTEVSFVGGDYVIAVERTDEYNNAPLAFFCFNVAAEFREEESGGTGCDHSETTIYCDHIADTETHTETEFCDLCEEQLGESLVADCQDEDLNLYCDYCNCWVACKHSDTVTEYVCGEGSEIHEVVVICANSYCTAEISHETAECEDADSDGMCDACEGTVVAEAVATEPQMGDLDGDGEVTGADADVAYSIVRGIMDATELIDLADVNGDGMVSRLDVAMIIAVVHGKLDAFPHQ